MNDLKGKIAIVTGGGTGIGRGVALALARQGVKTVICGRRQAPLGETLRAIREEPGSAPAMAVQADVSRAQDVALWG